jgi:hypothetical protein
MNSVALNCQHCGFQLKLPAGMKIQRRDSCESCGSDLHCCRNCRFFDPGKSKQCAEPQAELVSDKEKSNFCDYFEPRTALDLVNRTQAGPDDFRKQFDSLFKK